MGLTRQQQAALYFARKRRRLKAMELAAEQEDQGAQADLQEAQQTPIIVTTTQSG